MSKTHSLSGDTTHDKFPDESGKPSLADMEKRFAIHMNALQEHANRIRADESSPQATHSAMPPELARIRERLDRLSRKIGDAAETHPEGDHDARGSDAAAPEQIARLSEEMHAMREAMERVEAKAREPDLTPVTRAIQKNYAEIAAMLEQAATSSRPAEDSGRLDAIADRLETLDRSISKVAAKGENVSKADMPAIEKRLDELASAILSLTGRSFGEAGAAEKVEERISDLAGTIEELVELGKARSDEGEKPLPEPLQQLPQLLQQLDEKLAKVGNSLETYAESANGKQQQEITQLVQGLAGRIEEISGSGSGDISARFAELDAQLGKIVSQLESISPASADLGPVCERLDSIDRQLTLNRDVAIDVATQAAEQAVQLASASSGDGAGAAALFVDEVQKLEGERREEAQRRHHDFDVLQKTLVAVAERLNQIDDAIREIASVGVFSASVPAREPEPVAQAVVAETPMEDAEEIAAPDEGGFPAYDPQAFEPSHPGTEELLADQGLPVDLAFTQVNDEESFETNSDDVPLEPGSRAPDLTALVRHASERRMAVSAERRDREENAADYLAAARRAAQAAAEAAALSELEAAEEEEKLKSKPNRFESAFGLLKAHKKAVTLAASAVVFAAVAIPTAWYLASGQSFSNVEMQAAISQEGSGGSETGTMPSMPSMPSKPAMSAMPAIPVATQESADVATPAAAVPDRPPAQETHATAESGAIEPQETSPAAKPASPAPIEVATMPMKLVPAPPEQVGNAALRQAAASGNAEALFEIARRYTDGDGVERNLIEAAKWYELAAERGFAPAQYRYANFLEKGHGLSVDLTQSAMWYEKAAQSGNALAMHNLAVLLTSGLLREGVQLGNAIDWFRRAAGLGIKDSQVNLGIIYAKGLGTEKNLAESYKWFAVAARQGDADAAQKRDTIAAALSPGELEAARGQAEIWQPLPLDAEVNTPEVPKEWKNDSDEAASLNGDGFVAVAQQMLALRGFDPGPADGRLGERTRDAVVQFQQENGMKTDGKITDELVRKLTGGSA
jgi:localization factor PodJL